MPTRPAAEVDITPDLVRALLADQHPDLAELPLGAPMDGWDNLTMPLGTDLAIRLPRRVQGVDLLRNEQRWLPVLAAHCPVPVPAPLRTGHPAAGYPWPWSIVPWFHGTIAADQPVADRTTWAADLAAALSGLHALTTPADAPVNPYRTGALRDRGTLVQERIDGGQLDEFADRNALRTIWRRAVDAPGWTGSPRWLHGDPHPANLLVRDGTLAAVLDFGDMTSGDPACDLATAWLTFDAEGRAVFRAAITLDDPGLWDRAAGWAVSMASAMCVHSEDDPVIGAIGRHAMRQLTA
ncbi:aminoglycoside phosphotransferase family protein [Cellulomonas denverensis]|uniref:Aminoglycoside phosphotransferase family protein n=1 Tax=Cellulomonas denverensis TaxID=264297 RepID=A0A7X6KWM2_9CELL|nr:aminoglycoside phosphotransferase family protein [Cellulomonas denverensis]NKY23329.1 aminoglycoside phosphotransferase family protein [Cellulomonas denverensis]GIG24382.1 aminoglycoside phosphotransferase [Cellulomonas denverensis]